MNGERALAGRRILVVEDELVVALDLEFLLVKHGAVVLGPVNSVPAALAALKTGQPDAACLDVNLGGTSAAPVAVELAARSVPFVVITAYGDSVARMAELADARRLDKPYDHADVVDALRDVMGVD